jgi:molybdate transport system substrate-binding protein
VTLRRAIAFIALCGELLCPFPANASESPLIAVASGMQFAIREIAQAFEQETGIAPRITLGASGKLFRQIESRAPFEMFISADASLTDRIETQNMARAPGVVIARGRLAIFAPNGSPLTPDDQLAGLKMALGKTRIRRFAIANPAHAPYGMRAKEVLQSAGLWDAIQESLVIGENVAQATQFALSGAAQGGIVAHSLLVTAKTRDRGRYALLPEAWHKPILHSMVLLEKADDTTMQFYQFLESPKAQSILSRYGFTPAF